MKKSGKCLFGNGYDKYKKTCDFEVKVYNYASRPINSGFENPSVN